MNEKTNTSEDPYITIVNNPSTGEFTLSLHQWNIEKNQEGYTEEEAHELIGLLERGIYHLNNCIEDYDKETPKESTHEKETNKTKDCRRCPESIGTID